MGFLVYPAVFNQLHASDTGLVGKITFPRVSKPNETPDSPFFLSLVHFGYLFQFIIDTILGCFVLFSCLLCVLVSGVLVAFLVLGCCLDFVSGFAVYVVLSVCFLLLAVFVVVTGLWLKQDW